MMNEARYIPKEFSHRTGELIHLVEQDRESVWNLVARRLHEQQPETAGLMAPLFWQMSALFYHTCQTQHTPVVMLPERNVPLARELVIHMNVGLVVATPNNARRLVEILEEKKTIVSNWILVVPHDFNDELPELYGHVEVERHAIPGTPIS